MNFLETSRLSVRGAMQGKLLPPSHKGTKKGAPRNDQLNMSKLRERREAFS
jgi:hypothetical protein